MSSIQPQTGTPAAAVLRPRVPGRPVAPVDPYAAILAQLPRPLTGAQVSSQARAELAPLLAALTGQVGRQTQAATHAIGGYAADAASKLAGLDWQAPYAQAEQGQSAVDAALRQALSGAGSSDAEQLQQRLGVINDPSVAAAAKALAGSGAAAGNTELARGSSSLGQLLAAAAAAGSYGEKLPGISRLAGLQGISAAEQQGQQQIGQGSQQLEGQLPSIIQNLLSQSDSRASARASALQNRLARQDAIAATGASNQTRIAVEQTRAGQQQAAANARQFQQDRQYRLQWSKTYGYDPVTGATLPGYKRNANGDVVKVGTARATAAKAPAEYPNLTKGQVTHLRAGMAATFNGVPAVGTTAAVPPLSYHDAIDHAISQGYSRRDATRMANHFYSPGVHGRPRSAKQQQSARDAAAAGQAMQPPPWITTPPTGP